MPTGRAARATPRKAALALALELTLPAALRVTVLPCRSAQAGSRICGAGSFWSVGINGLVTLLDIGGRKAQVDQARAHFNPAGGAGRAEASAGARYLAGSTDYSTVIVAQTAAYAARQNPIQSVVDQQMATVALIQAIGGQWPKAGTPEPAAM